MVMRWNKEEEGNRRCVDVGVVIVGVSGVVVISITSLSRSCGEGVLVARTTSVKAGEVDAAVAALGVLRSCCWPGFGLLGVVTEVGWELGVP
jgi:hypothetical protein